MKNILIFVLCLFILQNSCHYIEHIDGGNVSIDAFTNQAK